MNRIGIIALSLALSSLVFAETPKQTGATNVVAAAKVKAAEPQPNPTILSCDTRTQLAAAIDSLVAPFKCDGDGNFYFREYSVDLQDSAPILRFDKDGKRTAMFDLAAVGRDMAGYDFTIGDHGTLNQLVYKKGSTEGYLAVYDKDGSLKSKITFDPPILPWGQIAAFSSGEFLVTGISLDGFDPKDPPPSKPFTGVFDASGKLVKRIYLEEADKQRPDQEEAIEKHNDRLFSIAYGSAVGASDGNVYVIRRSDPATMYVVSPAGAIIRTFKVNTEGNKPLLMVSRGDQLAVLLKNFGTGQKAQVRVLRLDGTEVGTYDLGPGLGSALGCYSDAGLGFLTGANGKLAVCTAEPQ